MGADESDFKDVSGLYGPGAFAGWLLTLGTSCHISFVYPEESGITDTLPHLLYVNCAAVDAFRRSIRLHDGLNKDHSSFAAVTTTTLWGLLHNQAQIAHCRALHTQTAWRRFKAVLFGSIVPLIASSSIWMLSLRSSWAYEDFDPGNASTLRVVAAASTIMLHLSLLSLVGYTFVKKIGLFRRPGAGSGHIHRLSTNCFVRAVTATVSPLLMILESIALAFGSSALCLLSACALQGLMEQDQIFSFAVVLTVLVYNAGLDVYKLVTGRHWRVETSPTLPSISSRRR